MTQEGLQRRMMLRNLVAACCALCLPEMAGCGKKSPSPESSSMPGAAAVPPATKSGMAAQPAPTGAESAPAKLAQAAVQYQDHPKGSESCSSCMHFIPETNSCKLVAGPISPQGWCTIWVKKMT
jgi:hypothetical protein